MSVTEHGVTNTEMEKDRNCAARVTCICGGVWERPDWDPDGESLPIWLAQHDREAFLDAKAGAEYRRVMGLREERRARNRTN